MDADVLRESCNLGSTWSRLATRNRESRTQLQVKGVEAPKIYSRRRLIYVCTR
jgi:hypothetical protein